MTTCGNLPRFRCPDAEPRRARPAALFYERHVFSRRIRQCIKRYYSDAKWQKIKGFADAQETPFLVILADMVKEKCDEFRQSFPYPKEYCTVKANPVNEVLALLRDLGSNFDIASIYELDKVLNLASRQTVSVLAIPSKKRGHIREAYEKGVRLFTTDSEVGIRNLAQAAPGSRIFFRVLMEAMTADWPLSRRIRLPTAHGDGIGLAGRRFRLRTLWHRVPRRLAATLKFPPGTPRLPKQTICSDGSEEEHIHLKAMNMGGGFPADYMTKANPLSVYAEEINRYIGILATTCRKFI